ncbi:uncharacterized protein [Dermacentor andersoni]|uniref:uncharacterized protein n=1 Tax=Dermacentor andersoni TaxID=34620 RepID=UPI003B3A49B6
MIPVVVLLLMALVAFVVLTFAFDADLFANKTIGLLYPASGARGAYPLENQTSTVGSSLIPATKDVKSVQNATPTPMTTTATTPSAVLWPFPKRDICSDSSPCNEQCIGNLFTEPWPMPDPGPWPLPGPNPWPMPEPKPRPMPEPNPGPMSEQTSWPMTQPTSSPMPQPASLPLPGRDPRPKTKRPSSTMPAQVSSPMPRQDPSHMSSSQRESTIGS